MTVARANARLNVYRNVADSAIAAVYLKLHTGDPGAAGTANASAVTTRNAVTFNAASDGSMTLNSIGTYSMTTSETITHWSLWDASTAGTYLESGAFTAGVPVINGSTLTINTFTLGETPLAA
jgi:hypothetical protein